MIMMKFVCETTRPYGIKTIVSMNTIMVDGTGMCGGCRLTVGGETKFACVDGPDFDGHLVDFDECNAPRRHVQGTGKGCCRAPRGALQPVQDGGQVIMPNMNPKKCPMPEQDAGRPQ